MSDDRFDDSNRPKRPARPPRHWNGITMEDYVRQALEKGDEESVIRLIKSLPDSSREKYRKIWKEFRDRKAAARRPK